MAKDPPTDPASEDLLRRISQRTKPSDRYKLEGEVARGGMGSIIKIWDEDLRRHLAMKVVLGKGESTGTGATSAVDSKQLARFLEEAQVTGQLDHPGIVPVHEVGLDSDGRVYFTMKLVKGETLKEILDHLQEPHAQATTFSPAKATHWTRYATLGVLQKVCDAMSYAHDKGVLHRDLKPGNVMVGKYGEVYVMDWGLARVQGAAESKDVRIRPEAPRTTSELLSDRAETRGETPDSPLYTMDGDVVGTPAYMSPEQAAGDIARMGPHSDVYAVGAMLYHMLAGHMPYVPPGARLNNYAVWSRVQEGPPTSIASLAPDAPAELVAICEKAMSRAVAHRYRSMSELSRDLTAYLEGRVVTAHETGTWAETRKWMRRNKYLAASLAAFVLVLVGWIVMSTIHARESELARAELERINKIQISANTELLEREWESKLRGLIVEIAYFETLDDDVHAYAKNQPNTSSEWWFDEAKRLLRGMPHGIHSKQPGRDAVERELQHLRSKALERSPVELARDRANLPRLVNPVARHAKQKWVRQMLGRDPWPSQRDVEAEIASIGWPDTSRECHNDAWRLVDPRRPATYGNEIHAVLLARRALEIAEYAGNSPTFRVTLSWALFRTGAFDEAQAEAQRAIDEIPQFGVPGPSPELDPRDSLARLKDEISRWQALREQSLQEDATGIESPLIAYDDPREERQTWNFEEGEDKWWHDELEKLVAAFDRLATRVNCAERSTRSREAMRAWTLAIEAVAASDRYRNTKWPSRDGLTAQLGLVPIGPDPDSGLWEFAHTSSGVAAHRDTHSRLVLTPQTGMVFVLLPGGRIPLVDPPHWQDKRLTTVELAPFFISKYEMTNEQWTAIGGVVGPHCLAHEPMLLVNGASWTDCMRALQRTGLWISLPSVAQWEFACRAGTSSRWWTGNDEASLSDVANVGSSKVASGLLSVAGRRPNGFGLHDVHGNAWEWCRDSASEGLEQRPHDGLCEEVDASERSFRGGSFREDASYAASSSHWCAAPEFRGWMGGPGIYEQNLGLRPVRALVP